MHLYLRYSHLDGTVDGAFLARLVKQIVTWSVQALAEKSRQAATKPWARVASGSEAASLQEV